MRSYGLHPAASYRVCGLGGREEADEQFCLIAHVRTRSQRRRKNRDVLDLLRDDADEIGAGHIENLAHRQHTPLELVRAIGVLKERGYSRLEIAAKVDFSAEYITAICYLLEHGEEKLIHAVDRRAFGVHLDVCNVINTPDRFYRNSEVISECFQKLSSWILSCHAKDLAWVTDKEYNVHFQETVPGRGQINYATYLKELISIDAPLMLEHLLSPEDYAEARAYVRRIAQESNVKLQ